MKTIQEQIKERAKEKYKIFHDIDQHLVPGIDLIEYKYDLQDAYRGGAESMLPRIKGIALTYNYWLSNSNPTQDDKVIEWRLNNDNADLYDYFLTNIFKPNLEK